jgi:outer membrane protein
MRGGTYMAGVAMLLAAAVATAQQAAPPPVKIGFVDVERSLVTIAEGRGRLKELQEWARPRQEELSKLAEQVSTLQQKLNGAEGDAAAELNRQLVLKQRELEDKQRDAQHALEDRRQSILKEIGEKMNHVITDYADSNHYTAVFILKQNDVAYLANSADITDVIVKLYDQKYPYPATQPAATQAPAK